MLLLVAGCDRLFQVDGTAAIDAGVDGVKHPPADAAADAPPDGPPQVMLVQQMPGGMTNTQIVSAMLQSPTAIDHVLIVIGGGQNGVDKIVGGGVSSWQPGDFSHVSPTNFVFYGVVDGTNAPVTLSTTNSAGDMWLVVTEWSALATVATHDTGDSNGEMGPGAVTLLATTNNVPDLMIFGISCASHASPSAIEPSCMSSSRFGVMNAYFGRSFAAMSASSWL